MSTKEELIESANHWRNWGKNESGLTFQMRRCAEDTAKALEIEAGTGIPVCPCHFKPYPDPNKRLGY